MLTRIIALARRISPGMNQTLVRLWYHYLAVADKEAHLLFMNYGYADLQPDAEALALSEVDERGSSSMCWRLYSAIIHGNWHLFIKRLQEYWRSRCKSSRRRKEQKSMKHFERESVTTAVFSSRNQGGSMFEKQRSSIAPSPGDHRTGRATTRALPSASPPPSPLRYSDPSCSGYRKGGSPSVLI